MPRTPASQWGLLFNFAGRGIVHMEDFTLIAGCTCYSEILIVDEELVFCGGDIILIIWPSGG